MQASMAGLLLYGIIDSKGKKHKDPINNREGIVYTGRARTTSVSATESFPNVT
jgi:hypothetical protein